MQGKRILPIYSLDKFRSANKQSEMFQVEIFDANRHFQVSYPHRHDFYEVLYLSQGAGNHIIDDNKYIIKPPCVFFLSPGQAHKLELSNDIGGYIFLFTSEFFLLSQQNKNRLLEFPFFFSVDRNNPPLYLGQKDDQFISILFVRGCKEVKIKGKLSDEIVRSILDLILLTCNNLYPEEFGAIHRGKGHILVKNFLKLIEENYQNNFGVNEYADKLNITSNHLTQLVKQVTGKTSSDLIQEKVIVEIKRFLLHTNMSVSEIALALNFSDQSYFTKFFRKKAGVNPLQFRKESMKNT